MSVEIPKDRIDQKLAEQFKDLRKQAAIPGFRPGHAPQKLIEKRFSADVKDQVRRVAHQRELRAGRREEQPAGHRRAGVRQSGRDQAARRRRADAISFQVEVQPEFTLPDLKSMKVKKPKIDVNDENVDQAMQQPPRAAGRAGAGRRPRRAGKGLPRRRRACEGGRQRRHAPARRPDRRPPGRIAGIAGRRPDKQLEGAKPGETADDQGQGPRDAPERAAQGQGRRDRGRAQGHQEAGAGRDQRGVPAGPRLRKRSELRDALREQMVEQINYDVQQAMREQVNKLPARQHADRPADQAVGPPGGPRREPPGGRPDDARHAARADRSAPRPVCAAARRKKRSAS